MDELLKEWRHNYDSMTEDTVELRAQLDTLNAAYGDIVTPYKQRMSELEDEIKAQALIMGKGHKAEGVTVNYRKGYERVSYDAEQTDVVLGFLRDVLPESAKSLEGARKSSFVSPSVSVKAIDKEE